MKYLITFILSFCVLFANAQKYKIKAETSVHPFEIKIEKLELKDGKALIHGKIKQKKNFSYNISFENCSMTIDDSSEIINGELKSWNGETRRLNLPKVVDCDDYDKFVLSFGISEIPPSKSFTLVPAYILNKDKTDIIFKNLKLKK